MGNIIRMVIESLERDKKTLRDELVYARNTGNAGSVAALEGAIDRLDTAIEILTACAATDPVVMLSPAFNLLGDEYYPA